MTHFKGPYMAGRYGAVVLLSGGMDSTTSLAVALGEPKKGFSGKIALETTFNGWGSGEVLGLSFDYGQRHRSAELQAARLVAKHYSIDHEVVDLTSLTKLLGGSSLTDLSIAVPDGHYAAETMRVTVVPNRNAIMLSIAFGVARAAGATQVYAGMHAGDHAIYPDCRPGFIHLFQETMDAANADIFQDPLAGPSQVPQLVTPFIQVSKQDIVTAGHLMHVPYELTYSCYKGEPFHCGTCGTCTERKEAFQLAGVKDPTQYALDLTSEVEV